MSPKSGNNGNTAVRNYILTVALSMLPLSGLAAEPSQVRKDAIKWAPVEESMAELVSSGANVVAAFNSNTNTDVRHWGEVYVLQKGSTVYRCAWGNRQASPNSHEYVVSSGCIKLVKP